MEERDREGVRGGMGERRWSTRGVGSAGSAGSRAVERHGCGVRVRVFWCGERTGWGVLVGCERSAASRRAHPARRDGSASDGDVDSGDSSDGQYVTDGAHFVADEGWIECVSE